MMMRTTALPGLCSHTAQFLGECRHLTLVLDTTETMRATGWVFHLTRAIDWTSSPLRSLCLRLRTGDPFRQARTNHPPEVMRGLAVFLERLSPRVQRVRLVNDGSPGLQPLLPPLLRQRRDVQVHHLHCAHRSLRWLLMRGFAADSTTTQLTLRLCDSPPCAHHHDAAPDDDNCHCPHRPAAVDEDGGPPILAARAVRVLRLDLSDCIQWPRWRPTFERVDWWALLLGLPVVDTLVFAPPVGAVRLITRPPPPVITPGGGVRRIRLDLSRWRGLDQRDLVRWLLPALPEGLERAELDLGYSGLVRRGPMRWSAIVEALPKGLGRLHLDLHRDLSDDWTPLTDTTDARIEVLLPSGRLVSSAAAHD